MATITILWPRYPFCGHKSNIEWPQMFCPSFSYKKNSTAKWHACVHRVHISYAFRFLYKNSMHASCSTWGDDRNDHFLIGSFSYCGFLGNREKEKKTVCFEIVMYTGVKRIILNNYVYIKIYIHIRHCLGNCADLCFGSIRECHSAGLRGRARFCLAKR